MRMGRPTSSTRFVLLEVDAQSQAERCEHVDAWWLAAPPRSCRPCSVSLIASPTLDAAARDAPCSKRSGQWSRPCCGLIFGVRAELTHPHDGGGVEQPAPILEVDPSARTPRGVEACFGEGLLPASKFCPWASQLLRLTSTNGTPRSTSRRASRHPWPNKSWPYSCRGSMSASFGQVEDLARRPTA